MTNKLPQITTIILATILIAGGFGLTQLAYSTGSNSGSSNSNNNNNNHDDDKIEICHIPPGNPNNPQTITIAKSALAAHLSHGDHKDECDDDDEDDDDNNGGGKTVVPPTITIVNNVASDPQPFTITVSPIVGVPVVITPTTTKYTVDSHTKVTISGSEDRQILITGDGNCPENNGGFVNIESGQDITCYYSDRPVGQAGPAPTVTLKVKILDKNLGVTEGNPPAFQVDGVDAPLGSAIILVADKATEITQTNDNVQGDVDENNEVLPSKITGDGHCPEVLAGTITLSTGQDIECVFEYGKKIEPGVIFHFDSIKFDLNDNAFGDNCFKGPTIPSVTPCYTRDENTGNFLIVPNLDSTNGQVLRASTLVLFDVIGIDPIDNAVPNPEATSQCTFEGLNTVDLDLDGDGIPDSTTSSIQTAFQLACVNVQTNPDDTLRLNYAMIETLMSGENL